MSRFTQQQRTKRNNEIRDHREPAQFMVGKCTRCSCTLFSLIPVPARLGALCAECGHGKSFSQHNTPQGEHHG